MARQRFRFRWRATGIQGLNLVSVGFPCRVSLALDVQADI